MLIPRYRNIQEKPFVFDLSSKCLSTMYPHLAPALTYFPFGRVDKTASISVPDSVDLQTRVAPKDGSWKKKKLSGQIAMTNMSASTSRENWFPIYDVYDDTRWGRVTNAGMENGSCLQDPKWGIQYGAASYVFEEARVVPKSIIPSVFLESDRLSITNAAKTSCFDELSAYDPLTELAEIPNLIRYILDLIRSGTRGLRSIKDPRVLKEILALSPNALKRKLEGAGSLWMQYRYAIMPVIYSAHDVAMALEEMKANAAFHTARGRDERRNSTSKDVVHDGRRYTIIEEYTEVVRVTCKRKFDIQSIPGIASILSLNPLRTGWELVPLSFVIDWFINVGTWLASLSYVEFADDVKTAISYVLERKVSIYSERSRRVSVQGVDHIKSYTTTALAGVSQGYEKVYRLYEREIQSNIPRPDLQFNPFINWKRAIDAAVLSWNPLNKSLRSL